MKGGLVMGMEVVGGGHGGRAGGRPASIILINSKGTHSVPNLSLQLAARLQYYCVVVLRGSGDGLAVIGMLHWQGAGTRGNDADAGGRAALHGEGGKRGRAGGLQCCVRGKGAVLG